MDFSRSVMIVGAPRSGTSWLGKIFDSHPDVLYRHEPDHTVEDPRLPFLIAPEDTERHVAIAADYAKRLLLSHSLKSAGQLPSFAKSYYSRPTALTHESLIHVLKWMEKLSGRSLSALPVPDLFNPAADPRLRIVIKSVSARGRAATFVKAMPGARFVFLLRHPCGQIASALRGLRTKKMFVDPFIDTTLATPAAKRLGLQRGDLQTMPLAGQLAWQWVSLNELALEAFDGRENARLTVYEDVCADPVTHARELLAFAGLEWNEQTEDFIRRSTSYSGAERYYSVFRNAISSVSKWRSELSEEDQRIILDIARQSRLAVHWPDIQAAAQSALPA